MRFIRVVPALLLLTSGPAFAQESIIDYVSKQDYFSINFPGQPKVEDTTFADEYRITLPARVYTATQGRNRYKVTVVDYRGVAQIHAARVKQCVHDAGADNPGLTQQQRRDLIGDTCQDETPKDVRGAMMWATWNLVEKASKVTHLAHYNIDVIEGHEVHTINPDESRTYAAIHMYENRLYIAEATVPKGAPASNWFQISLRFLDEQYQPVRYQYSGLMTYSNGYPKPPLANQNQGAQGQAAQGGRGQGAQGR